MHDPKFTEYTHRCFMACDDSLAGRWCRCQGPRPEEVPPVEPEMHTCPYKEDINGDYETLCSCSPEQTQQCAWDI